MIDIRVQFPKDEALRLLNLLDPKAMAFAESQAVNRTAKNVQSFGLELIAKKMGISKAKLRKRGRGVSATGNTFGTVSQGRRSTRRTLSTTVTGYGRPFNAGRWDGQEIRSGASTSAGGKRKRRGKGTVLGTQHRAYGRPQVAPRTWMLRNGAIVVRDGNSFRGVFGPGVAQQMGHRDVMGPLQKHAQERFLFHFKEAVEFAFSAQGKRAVRGIRGSRR